MEGGCPIKKRPSFTKEFKLEAVRLLELGTKSPADLARELEPQRTSGTDHD
jgi:transposase-like protein